MLTEGTAEKENPRRQRGHHRSVFVHTVLRRRPHLWCFCVHAWHARHLCHYPFLKLSTSGRHFNPTLLMGKLRLNTFGQLHHIDMKMVVLQNVKPKSIRSQHSGSFLCTMVISLEGQKLVRNFRSHRNNQQTGILKICLSAVSMLKVLQFSSLTRWSVLQLSILHWPICRQNE